VRDKRITFQKLYDEGKYPHEMTWEDFKRFPIWVDCLEIEGKVSEDFLAPIIPPVAVPYSPRNLDLMSTALVCAEFILADGTVLHGAIVIHPADKSLVNIEVLVDEQLRLIPVPPQGLVDIEGHGHDLLCKWLNKKPEQVFPIRFRCPVGFEGEEGVIEGEYPIDFRADRGIKLVRWRKHILYEQGKYAPQLTRQDFNRFPFWVGASSIWVWQDTFFAPVDLPSIPKDAGVVLLEADFVLADRTTLKGAVEIDVNPWERILNGILLLVGDQLEAIDSSPQLCEVLGKGVREVFPVRFRCFIGFEGEEGVIEGEIPKTFHYDRPIKLGKGRKRR